MASKATTSAIGAIVSEYKRQIHDYRELQEHVDASLRRLKAECPSIHSVKTRMKAPESLRLKLIKKAEASKGKLNITADNFHTKINDLVGARVLHLHTGEFQEIDLLLRKGFASSLRAELINGRPEAKVWDPEYRRIFRNLDVKCVEKDSMYTSVHYEFRTAGRSPRLTFEVQVRTLAEELWGETDHRIRYKTKNLSQTCRDQIFVLARATSTCTRLVDSIFSEHRRLQLGASPESD